MYLHTHGYLLNSVTMGVTEAKLGAGGGGICNFATRDPRKSKCCKLRRDIGVCLLERPAGATP